MQKKEGAKEAKRKWKKKKKIKKKKKKIKANLNFSRSKYEKDHITFVQLAIDVFIQGLCGFFL